MKKILAFFLLLGVSSVNLFLLSPKEASAANPAARTLTTSTITATKLYNTPLPFYESLPRGYNDNTSKSWPVIIFLHGLDERGNGTTELSRVLSQGLPQKINQGEQLEFTVNGVTESFIVLAPQLASSAQNWHFRLVEAMIDHAIKTYRVDPSRIYLTGLSLGAFATWDFPITSLANANRIAAIAPTDGGGGQGLNFWDPVAALTGSFCNIAQAGVAVWQFSGANDNAWGWSVKNAVDNLTACNPTAEFKKTVYDGVGHGAWGRTYDTGHTYQNPNVYEWLLAQRRGGSSSTSGNQPPTASAHPDQTIVLPTNSALLQSTSSDDGAVMTGVWSQVSGPSQATIVTPTTAWTDVRNLIAGTYVFKITVTDNNGATGSDTVTITVVTSGTPANNNPSVNAGSDQTITLPANAVTLIGSGTDTDGSIASYTWSKTSGGAATITSPNSSSTTATGLAQGTYVFRLTVSDNRGATATDDVQIVVQPALQLMASGTERIVITPDMLINEGLTGNEAKLFNEQNTLVLDAGGNPLQASRPVVCKGVWEEPPVNRTCFHINDTNSNRELSYPGKIIVDLGRKYKITDIYLYDDRGGTHAAGDNEPLQVWAGGPMSYTQKIATHNFEQEDKWVRLSVTPAETRYLQLRFNDGHGFIGEMVLYGIPLESKPAAKSIPNIKPKYTFDKLVGTNISFGMGHDLSGKKYDEQWGTVRYFGGYRWSFNKQDELGNLDDITKDTITRLTAKGVSLYSVISGAAWTMINPTDPFYISEEYNGFTDRKAIDYTLCVGSKIVGGQPSCNNVAQNPASWAHKAWLSKRAAKRDYDQGLRMIELENEPDGFWRNAGYHTPYEAAAMISADYDGHCNTLRYNGETVGVKNAVPNMKVLMPAVSQHDSRYLRAMEFWFEHNRTCAPTFPADVINFHTYATTLGYQFAGQKGVSMPPEEFGLREQAADFVSFRNRYAPNAETAMTEFGVDTYYEKHPDPNNQYCGKTIYGDSWAYAPRVGSFDEKEVQAQWLTRSFLEAAAAGLDFVNQFWLSDQYREEESCYTFTTAGVLKIKSVTNYRPSYEPKPSWYYIQTLRSRLAGMQYESEKDVTNGVNSEKFRIMKFRHVQSPNTVAYVLWSPTKSDIRNPNFTLSLDRNAQVSVVELVNGSETGALLKSSSSTVNSISLPVSERPILVIANESGGPVLTTSLAATARAEQIVKGTTPIARLTGEVNNTAIASILWTQTTGPTQANIKTPTTLQTEVDGLTTGAYTFDLLVVPTSGLSVRSSATLAIETDTPRSGGGGGGSGGRSGGGSSGGGTTTPNTSARQQVRVTAQSTLRVRATPGGTVIGNTTAGTVANVIERIGDWVRVQFANGSEGWISALYTAPLINQSTPAAPVSGGTTPGGERVSINVRTTLQIRTTPGGTLLARATGGTTATVIERGKFIGGVEWVKLRFGTGLEGWAVDYYLKPIANSNQSTGVSVRTTAQALNVRLAPGGVVVGTVPLGTIGTVIGNASGSWIQVRFANGVQGYAHRSYLQNY